MQVLAVCLIVQQQIKSIAADFLHLLDLDHDLLGEGNLLFFDHIGVFADVHGVVADALEVAADLKECAHVLGILRVALFDQHTGDVLGDFLVQIVDILLTIAYIFHQSKVIVMDSIKAQANVFAGHLGHANQLVADGSDGDRRDTDFGFAAIFNRNKRLDVLQVHDIVALLRQVRQDAGRQFGKISAERDEQDGGGDIKDGVHIGNLCRNVVRGKAFDQSGERS